MPLLSTIAALGGALTLAAGPLAASTSPVSVVACDYSSVQGGSGANLIEGGAMYQASNLRITFVNQAPLAATNVRFAVRYENRTQTIDDAGLFSSGTPITQDFVPAASSPYSGPVQCTVEAVTFSDGSTWQPA